MRQSLEAVGIEGKVSPLGAIPLPQVTAPDRKEEIPTGPTVSIGGDRLYVTWSPSDRLTKIGTQTRKMARTRHVRSESSPGRSMKTATRSALSHQGIAVRTRALS